VRVNALRHVKTMTSVSAGLSFLTESFLAWEWLTVSYDPHGEAWLTTAGADASLEKDPMILPVEVMETISVGR